MHSYFTQITYLGQENVPNDIPTVQSMVYVMNPENKSIDQRLAAVKPPVIDDEIPACSSCKSSGMCANCPERTAAITSRAAKAKQSNVVGEGVPVIDTTSTSEPSVEETDYDAVSEGSSGNAEVDVAPSSVIDIADLPQIEKLNLRKYSSARTNKSPARRAANGAIKSDKTTETLSPLKEIIEKHSKGLKNALSFNDIVQLLKNSNNNLKLTVISPATAVEQLDMIYLNVKDRSTKTRITKLKNRINQEFQKKKI